MKENIKKNLLFTILEVRNNLINGLKQQPIPLKQNFQEIKKALKYNRMTNPQLFLIFYQIKMEFLIPNKRT